MDLNARHGILRFISFPTHGFSFLLTRRANVEGIPYNSYNLNLVPPVHQNIMENILGFNDSVREYEFRAAPELSSQSRYFCISPS